MGEDSPRAVLIGSLRLQRGLAAQTVAGLFTGERFAPAPLTEAERTRLETGTLADAPVHVAGDVPEWVVRRWRALGDDLLPELRALARRAPLDIRVNTLKATRQGTAEAIAHLAPEPTPLSPDGLGCPRRGWRGPALHVEPEFLDGWFEIQDEGSQLAARLSGAAPGMTVIDLCAGRRRQDPGARRPDGQRGPADRHRQRPGASRRSTSACAGPAPRPRCGRPAAERDAPTS